jgi:hypothetical protein
MLMFRQLQFSDYTLFVIAYCNNLWQKALKTENYSTQNTSLVMGSLEYLNPDLESTSGLKFIVQREDFSG